MGFYQLIAGVIHNIPVTYKANQNAWMTFPLFKEWFQNSFVPNVRQHLKSKGLAPKAILLLDNATCHPQDGVLHSDDGLITTMCLPPNCTALIQPLDQNIIHLIKHNYKKSLLADLITTEGDDLNQKLKKYNIKNSVFNLADAWEKISSVSIKNSWKNLLSDSPSWTEEDELPLSVIREAIINENLNISSLLQEVLSQDFSSIQINNWVDEGFTPSRPENLNEYLTEDVDEVELEDSSDDVENVTNEQKIKVDDGIRFLNSSLQWAYENERPACEILVLKTIRDAAIDQKFTKAKKQTNILNFFTKS